jgi:hypothetical protein
VFCSNGGVFDLACQISGRGMREGLGGVWHLDSMELKRSWGDYITMRGELQIITQPLHLSVPISKHPYLTFLRRF